MPKVLISDKMSPLAEQIFKERGLEVDYKPGMTPDELKACIGEYDGLAIRSATKVTAEILAAANNLKVVGRAGIGVDNVDVPGATGRGVVVMNTPFGNSITTAEHAISMMMALARQIPEANASTHAGKWEKSKFMGVELMGKTLGVIGCGNIGAVTADRAQGLKMRVVAFDPYLSQERAKDLGVEKVELDELFARADFITLHTPLTDTTRNIIGASAFKKMKDGVRIINCARGGLVDEVALKEALESGKVGGAALDVFAQEPAKENPLFGMANVVATPHLGASTTEAQVNVAVQVAEQISDYLLTGAVVNALNMPSVSAEDAPKLRPYMKLAEEIGSFAGQITQTGIKGVSIEFEGAVAELNTKPLSAIVLKGLLSPMLESVNMVSAPVIAKERDIEVSEVKRDREGEYTTMIRLVVTTESQTRSVSGTLFAGKPRLVEINGIAVEAEVGPHMLYITNEDKPGFIGKLGTALGFAGVNIATFHLGRNNEGGEALALLQVDQKVSDETLAEVRKLPHVVRAEALDF
ncbi:MAG: phosphoglycerate dehydrogenase [Rhodospirillales bacterium]|nr:phosphoglycerate dehydrogenase [Rhodospirillales bacterium]MCW8862097.1 phosphoglycerate dehydrogenase [Rhodospirillales bacterium]MCW8952308.1 phosphoglycerate dehydrogenase [Rhodospirillales bacterium]MCW8970944.1 phosphoglycerate dehydrogenase [Rhodospirillales bacterium]MCW9003200.1 phosphoglycerate dehydrogenase [Rhodospirillales bacterium]